jgi:hypothetical protein
MGGRTMKKKPIYKKWWVWIIAFIVIGIFVPKPSEDDNSSKTATHTAAVEKTKEANANVSQKKESVNKKEQEAQTNDKQTAADLKKYFDDNMTDSSWYSLIKVIDVSNDNVFIRTSAPSSDVGKAEIKGINNAVWGYTNQNGSKYKFKSVTIYAENGHPLLSEDNPMNK